MVSLACLIAKSQGSSMIRTNLKEDHRVLKSCQKVEADDLFIEFLHGIQVSHSENNLAKRFNGSGGFAHF